MGEDYSVTAERAHHSVEGAVAASQYHSSVLHCIEGEVDTLGEMGEEEEAFD